MSDEQLQEPLVGIDAVLSALSRPLGLCGHGKDDNWSIRFHNYFFYNCACCLLFRGIAIGFAIGVCSTALIGYIINMGRLHGL